MTTKRSPNLIEVDRRIEFYVNVFQNFLNKNNNKFYSRNTTLGAVSAENFYRTIRDLHKKPVFERGDGNSIDSLSTITKQYDKRSHSSSKFTPIEASLKKNEGYVYKSY